MREEFSKVYPEFKIVSPRLVKVNVKTDDGRLILDVFRNGKFCKTVTVIAEGERVA
jgi:hypothetical protein